jgi:hypothetical protein
LFSLTPSFKWNFDTGNFYKDGDKDGDNIVMYNVEYNAFCGDLFHFWEIVREHQNKYNYLVFYLQDENMFNVDNRMLNLKLIVDEYNIKKIYSCGIPFEIPNKNIEKIVVDSFVICKLDITKAVIQKMTDYIPSTTTSKNLENVAEEFQNEYIFKDEVEKQLDVILDKNVSNDKFFTITNKELRTIIKQIVFDNQCIKDRFICFDYSNSTSSDYFLNNIVDGITENLWNQLKLVQ